MSLNVNTFNIPLLGDLAADASSTAKVQINARLVSIQNALNDLVGRISSNTSKSTIIQQNVPLSANVLAGMLVYFNGESGHMQYEPALAALRSIPTSDGQSIEAPSARVEGMVLSTYTDSENTVRGTIMLGGVWQDDAAGGYPLLTTLLGNENSTKPGVYYLSAINEGRCTDDPGIHLRQPLVSNHGNGLFSLNIFYMAHDNHFHGSATLNQYNWMSVSTLPEDVATAPDGARFWYNGNVDYSGLGELSANTTVVFSDGILQSADAVTDYVVDQGYIWYTGGDTAPDATVTLFNYYPFGYNGPIVRSVEVAQGNNALTARTTNGKVVLTPNDFTYAPLAASNTAISGISGNVLGRTPILSGLVAGPGMQVSVAANGIATISASRLIGVPLDAYSIFHQGTNLTCDGNYIYISFPARTTSSFVMSMPVTDVDDGISLTAKAWCLGIGGGTTFDVRFYWAPLPAGTAEFSGTAIAETTLTYGAAAGSMQYAESTGSASITGKGMLSASISQTSAASSSQYRMLRVGFKLNLAQGI